MKKKVFVSVFLLILFVVSASAQKKEEDGRKTYESGMSFYTAGKYEEALKDFDSVIEKYATSNWAALSLLQKGIYYKDIGSNLAEARANFEKVIQLFPKNKKTSLALFNLGKIKLLQCDEISKLNEPLADFEKLIKSYPGSEFAASAAYEAANIYYRLANIPRALEKIKTVDERFASSSFYPDAILLKGIILASEGEYVEAAKQLQDLANTHKESAQSLVAKKYLAALQRLKLDKGYKYKIDSAFKLNPSEELKKPVNLFLDQNEQIVVFDQDSKMIHFFDFKGASVNTQTAQENTVLFFMDKNDKTYTIDSEGNLDISGNPVPLTYIDQEQQSYQIQKPRFLCLGDYNFFVVPKKGNHIFRFDLNGTFQHIVSKYEFEEIKAIKVDVFNRIWVIDESVDGILTFYQTGLQAGSIPLEGMNYKMKEPKIIKFDRFNNLFLYDEGLKSFLVFDNAGLLLKQIPLVAPIEEIQDFVVSDSGELYILEADANSVYKMY